MKIKNILSNLKNIGPAYKTEENISNLECTENSDKMVLLFLSIPFSLLIVYFGYYLFFHVFYPPGFDGGYAVFLSPRFYGGMNDLHSEIFRQWKELFIVVPLLFVTIYFAFWIGIKKNALFWKYLILIYYNFF